jgi:hypothetical protein
VSYEEPDDYLVERNYAIIVRDIGQVYKDLDDFTVEAKTMVSSYSLPADIEAIVELTDEQVATLVQGVGRKVTPTGSPAPTRTPAPDISDPHEDPATAHYYE